MGSDLAHQSSHFSDVNERNGWAGQWSLAITTCWNPHNHNWDLLNWNAVSHQLLPIEMCTRKSASVMISQKRSIWNAQDHSSQCCGSIYHFNEASTKAFKNFNKLLITSGRDSSFRIISIINQKSTSETRRKMFISFLAVDFYNQWKQLLLIIWFLKEQRLNNKKRFS